MNAELRARTVKAIGHLGLGGGLSKVISLASTLVIARLLSPADYGLMAMAMVLVGFIGFFNEAGIGAALIQRAGLSDAVVNGCFLLALLASVVLCLLTCLLSWPTAAFFGHPQLQPMIALLSSAFIFGAAGTVPTSLLRRDMHFKAVAAINILGVLIQSGLSLALAWLGMGAWALVWAFVASSVMQAAAAFWLCRWRPRGPADLRGAAGVLAYGLHVTASRVFWYLYSNADKLVIGKVLGDRALGTYDMSYSLATLPTSQVTGLATNVASPLFSKLQHDLVQLRAFIVNITRGVAYVTYPLLVGMLVTSRELVLVLLGPKWIEMLVPFGALCLMGLFKSVDPLLSQALISTGHARRLSGYTLLCGVVMTAAVVAGAHSGGLGGVALAWTVVYPLLSLRLLYLVRQVTGLGFGEYYRALMPVAAATAAMAVAVLLAREALAPMHAGPAPMLAAEVAVGAAAYVLWIVRFDARGLNQIRQVMLDLGIPERKLARWPFTRALPQ